MGKKKRDGAPAPRDLLGEAIETSLHRLCEHVPCALIILPSRESDRQDAKGPVPPIVRFRGDMASVYGLLAVAAENAELYGFSIPEDDDDDDESAGSGDGA